MREQGSRDWCSQFRKNRPDWVANAARSCDSLGVLSTGVRSGVLIGDRLPTRMPQFHDSGVFRIRLRLGGFGCMPETIALLRYQGGHPGF
jgi:hypothetical protein